MLQNQSHMSKNRGHLGGGYEDEEDSHRNQHVSSADKATDKVTQAVGCVANCRPFNIVKDAGLQKLVWEYEQKLKQAHYRCPAFA